MLTDTTQFSVYCAGLQADLGGDEIYVAERKSIELIEVKVEVINLPTHQGPLTINLIPVILSMPMLSNRSRQLLNFFAMIMDVLGGEDGKYIFDD